MYIGREQELKINPFEFFEACRYFTKLSDEDKALAYGIVGGTPHYLMQLDNSLSIEDNIKNTHLNASSSIFEEPNNLLKQEVREPAIYNAVITAIATGCSKMSEISNKIDEDTSVCATDLAYSRIAPQLNAYMGNVFEEICKQYLWKLLYFP